MLPGVTFDASFIVNMITSHDRTTYVLQINKKLRHDICHHISRGTVISGVLESEGLCIEA